MAFSREKKGSCLPEDFQSLTITTHHTHAHPHASDLLFLLYSSHSSSPTLPSYSGRNLGFIRSESLTLASHIQQRLVMSTSIHTLTSGSITSLGRDQSCPIPHSIGSSLILTSSNKPTLIPAPQPQAGLSVCSLSSLGLLCFLVYMVIVLSY